MTTKRRAARVVALGVVGLASALIIACTPYQPMGFMGGVDDLQLNETTYRIIARGNAYTSSERVWDFVLLRASEIAISRGYKGFVVVGEADQSSLYQYTETKQETAMVTGVQNTTGCIAYTTPGAMIKPGHAIIVTLVQEGGMDAHMINASLAPKYGATPMALPAAPEAPAPQPPASQTSTPPPTSPLAQPQ